MTVRIFYLFLYIILIIIGLIFSNTKYICKFIVKIKNFIFDIVILKKLKINRYEKVIIYNFYFMLYRISML